MRLTDPDPDLAALPTEVRSAAHVFTNKEVAWPNDQASDAIEALAATGKRILGLDARTLYPDGGVTEIPISAYEPDDDDRQAQVDGGKEEALAALPLAIQEGTHVLITWD